MVSRFKEYDDQIKSYLLETNPKGTVEIAKLILKTTDGRRENLEVDSLSKYIRRNQKSILDEYEGVYDVSDTVDVDNKTVSHYWDKRDPRFSVFVKNPNHIKPEEAPAAEIDFTSIYKEIVKPVVVTNVTGNCYGLFDRLVYSDVHIGMDVNKDGYALYDGNWDETELNARLDKMVSKVIADRKSDTLYISDLGDYLDGWDGETVRRGHHLPQNMDNQKVFDVGLAFKVKMIDALVPHFNKIISRNITDDNHSGAFSYIVNSAFKALIELKYPERVEVHIQRKFIDHYKVGNYIFIETHGKDGKNLKFGFKPVLDPANEKKIKKYIEEHWLMEKGVKIEFSKGDSHQYIFDHSTGSNFNYYNYPAFSPPSNWVGTNFGKSMSGFVFFNYLADGQKTTHDYIF